MTEVNDLLQPENYYEKYNENIENLKNNPKAMEIDKLCYLVFRSEEGKQLIELFKNRYLLPSLVHPENPNLQIACVYMEGFKEGYRQIIASIESHQQRIDAENHK